MVWKLNDGFNVTKFQELIQADYIYSYDKSQDKYRLFSNNMFGEVANHIVEAQKQKSKVIIIQSDTMEMFTFNISETETINAMMGMGRM